MPVSMIRSDELGVKHFFNEKKIVFSIPELNLRPENIF